jgi:hypothetical protein
VREQIVKQAREQATHIKLQASRKDKLSAADFADLLTRIEPLADTVLTLCDLVVQSSEEPYGATYPAMET